MLDRLMLYNITYALAATDGREQILFGKGAPLAQRAFTGSLAGNAFPEIWFELPLAGDPWFDLHVLTSHEDLQQGTPLAADAQNFHPDLVEWFARQPSGVRQLAYSHDISKGIATDPAVQLLLARKDLNAACGFLEAAKRPDLIPAYRAFIERLPQGWFACYLGVFPSRPDMGVRIECIPEGPLQGAYAADASLLEAHLRQTGYSEMGETLIPRCQQLARTPFQLEFQFDVAPDGATGRTLGVSLRFACPPGTEEWQPFEASGEAGKLMGLIESWGLADDRWRLFEDAMFAKRATLEGSAARVFNFPAFIKLRWIDGAPHDGKAYFLAGIQRC